MLILETHKSRIAETQIARGCRLVWSRLVASGAIDPGSNPGSPIQGLKPSGYGTASTFFGVFLNYLAPAG
jgi:hypothetical protein